MDKGHPLTTNMWYAYAYSTAKSLNKSNCYVCSLMPQTTKQPSLTAKGMSLEEAKCFASMSHLGFQHPGIVLNQIIVPPYQRDTAIKRGRCSTLFFPVFHFNMTGPPLAMKVFFNHIHYVHDKCYAQDMGNISLGALNVSTQCKRGRTLVFGEGAPCNMSGYSNGTYPTDGGMWLCGNSAYYVLPPGW